MIVLACGDREWTDKALIECTLAYLRTHRSEPLTVIEGRCRGADRLAGQWAARMRAHGVGWVAFPADWNRYGKGAGPIRNRQMLDWMLLARASHTLGVVAFHDRLEASKGTKNMVVQAKAAGVPVKIVKH